MTRPRTVLATGTVLFGVMLAHALLETARDALFLAKLGPDRLAWAYLAIAGCALVAFTALRRWSALRDPRRLLIAFLGAAVVGTTLLAATLAVSPTLIFVLYVWTGVIATLVVPAFWTLVDRSHHADEAKRVFAAIGAGGVLGALVGSALAAMLGRIVAPRHLVTAGAVAFAAVAVAAIALAPHATAERLPVRRSGGPHRSHRFIRVLVGLGIVSTVTLTLGDLAFKRVVAERLPAADLATVFGTIYTGLNVLGLAVQLVIAPRLLSRLGVGPALVILPLALAAGALGFAATGATVAIVALKLGDGALRHSLHRVTSEILYLPVPAAIRDRAKPIADALAHRGGQVAAVLIMLAISASSARLVAAVVAGGALLWLVAAMLARSAYVARFREMLLAGGVQRRAQLPALDAQSIDLLEQSLASPDEAHAQAALELLAREPDRVPALVLYHPRTAVVRRALRVLEGESRPDVAAVVTHLLDHPDPEIRAEALAASSRTGRHRDRLIGALDDALPEVRAAAAVGLIGDPETGDAATACIAAMVAGSLIERGAVVRAIARRPDERFRSTLAAALATREPSVMRVVIETYARAPQLADLPRLIGLLEDPYLRGDVRRVLVAAGAPGLELLVGALDDPQTPLGVRRHVPRSLSAFQSAAAAAALVARLPHEPDGTTEHKILRALGRMRDDDPRLAIDPAPLRHYARRAIAQAARFTVLHDHLDDHDEAATAGSALLRELLLEKRRDAIEHAFRALGILDPRSDLRTVHDALTGDDGARRSAAREIAEAVIDAETRTMLFATLDDVPPAGRRERLGPLAPGPFATHEAFVAELLGDPSESLRCLVAYYIAERRLVALRPALLRSRPHDGPELVAHAFDQAIARLDERP